MQLRIMTICIVVFFVSRKLLGVDKDGLSDPYVKLSVLDATGRVLGDPKKTKFVKDDLNPHFDERSAPMTFSTVPMRLLFQHVP